MGIWHILSARSTLDRCGTQDSLMKEHFKKRHMGQLWPSRGSPRSKYMPRNSLCDSFATTSNGLSFKKGRVQLNVMDKRLLTCIKSKRCKNLPLVGWCASLQITCDVTCPSSSSAVFLYFAVHRFLLPRLYKSLNLDWDSCIVRTDWISSCRRKAKSGFWDKISWLETRLMRLSFSLVKFR